MNRPGEYLHVSLILGTLVFLLCHAVDARAQKCVDAAAAQTTWHLNASGQHTTGYSPMGFALDALGRPLVTFQVHVPPSYKDLVIGTLSGGVWQLKTVASGDMVGVSSAVAMQPNGDIAVAFTDDEYAAYAVQETDHWSYSYIDAMADHMFRDIGLGYDASGTAQVGYWDSDANVVKYARYDAAKEEWAVEIVASGVHAQFLVDAAGVPHFVYSSDDGRLVHAQGMSIGWTFETLPSGMASRFIALKGSQVCMVYDYAGNPAGLYYRCGAAGAEQLIDANGRSGILAFSPSGAPHVVYFNSGTGKRMIAALHGGQWLREPITPDLGDISLGRLIIDGEKRPHLAFAGDNGVTYAWADGSIVPESEFALSPNQVAFVTHFVDADASPEAALVTRFGEPASKDDEFDIMLQVTGKQDVAWEVKAPPWVEVRPAAGRGPATLRVGLKFAPGEVRVLGERTGTASVQSPDGKISATLRIVARIAPRRYIQPVNPKLVDQLKVGLLYTESLDPQASTRPVGSVLLWTDSVTGTVAAHSTVVVNDMEQLGMGRTVVREPRTAAATKPSGKSKYTLLAVWEPPAVGNFDQQRIPAAYLSTSLPREYGDLLRQWNCHGYSAVLVYFGFEPSIRVTKGASVRVTPGSIQVNQGQVWYRGGGRMNISTPLGPFDVNSECTVDVRPGGPVELRLFSGSAVYRGSAGDVSLGPNERIVVAVDGRPGPVTAFDPATIDRWWEWIDVEDYGLFLPAVRR